METGSRKRRVAIKAGVRLKELRLSLGFSQALMAEKTGSDELYLSFCEKGKYEPTVHFLCSLCEKFNVNPRWLIDGEKNQPMFTKHEPNGLARKQKGKNRLKDNTIVPNAGPRLRELRKKLGLTVPQMTKIIGCGKSVIGDCECGAHNTKISLLKKICEEFAANPKWLIDGEMGEPMVTGPKGLAMEEEAKKRLEENAIVPDGGPRLKELRKKLGITTPKMTEIIGCGKFVITNCECGFSKTRISLLKKICKEFGANPQWLIEGEMDQPMFTGPKGLAMEQEGKNRLEESIIVPDGGPRLKELRKKLGITAPKMTKIIGCGKFVIANCESELIKTRISLLKKICEEFAANPKWLIEGQMDQPMFTGPKGLQLEEEAKKRLGGCIIAPHVGSHLTELAKEANNGLKRSKIALNIGSRLRKLRQMLGLTSKKMAEICSCSRSLISICEIESQKPSLKYLKRICDNLNANPKWLIEGQMDQPMFLQNNAEGNKDATEKSVLSEENGNKVNETVNIEPKTWDEKQLAPQPKPARISTNATIATQLSTAPIPSTVNQDTQKVETKVAIHNPTLEPRTLGPLTSVVSESVKSLTSVLNTVAQAAIETLATTLTTTITKALSKAMKHAGTRTEADPPDNTRLD